MPKLTSHSLPSRALPGDASGQMHNEVPDRTGEPTSANRFRPRLGNWLMVAAVAVGLLIIGLVYYRATYVSGVELNSHTWEQRVFSLRRDPFTGRQLGGVRHNAPVRINPWTTVENPRAKKMGPSILNYFEAQPTAPQRWDLVHLDDSPLPGARASIVVNLLAARGRNHELLWPQWTLRHPERAAILWPAAQQLVAADQYTWLPLLFEQAILENSTQDFSESAGQLVASALDRHSQSAAPPQASIKHQIRSLDRQP